VVRQCLPIPHKIYNNITKRLKTPVEKVEQYFPWSMAFIDSTGPQQITRPIDKERSKIYYSGKKEKICCCKESDHG
jgi:hypothetical protein